MTRPTLERRIVVRARPETVFSFFTDSTRFADWWGAGSTIDARPGGAVRIVYPNGVVVSGEVLELDPGRHIAFTYGYEGGQGPVPPGATRVDVTLAPHAEGTALHLVHAFDEQGARDAHVPGWRYQLAVFANVAARAEHADLDGVFDRFFAAQAVDGEDARCAALAEVVTDDFAFRDTFACVTGAAEMAAYVEAGRAHGMALAIERDGAVRHCQGVAVCDWLVRTPDGAEMMRGTNVARLAPDGRLADVVGLWTMPGR